MVLHARRPKMEYDAYFFHIGDGIDKQAQKIIIYNIKDFLGIIGRRISCGRHFDENE